MRVRMTTKIGGFRNGEEWPDKGAVIEVPDHEGRDLIAAGYAEEARHGPKTAPGDDETAPTGDDGAPSDDGSGETPTEADDAPKPKVKRTRKRSPKPTDG